jgi:hypothetical protein
MFYEPKKFFLIVGLLALLVAIGVLVSELSIS